MTPVLKLLLFEFSTNTWNLIIQIVGSAVGGIIAIGVYLHGNKKSKAKDDDEKKQFERDKLRYLYSLIKGSQRFSTGLMGYIEEFTNKIDDSPSYIPRLRMSPHNRLSRFVHVINHEEHFHAYRNQLPRSSSVLKIFDTIDYIESLRVNVYEQFSEGAKRNSEDLKNFTARFNEAMDVFLLLFPIRKVDNDSEQQLLIYLDSKVKIYRKLSRKGDLKLLMDQFINPVTFALIKYQLSTMDYKYTSMLSLFTASTKILTQTMTNNLELAESVKDDLKNLKASYFQLIEYCQSLEAYMTDIGRYK